MTLELRSHSFFAFAASWTTNHKHESEAAFAQAAFAQALTTHDASRVA
jgi:sugar/nucleoside kinase (ribokinase family)